MAAHTYTQDLELEDPYNENYNVHEEIDDYDPELFFDEATSISDLDDPENPFTPDFQDFEVDNFSEEDLKDFYFHYHFSAVSFKFFSRFNKKFKKLS